MRLGRQRIGMAWQCAVQCRVVVKSADAVPYQDAPEVRFETMAAKHLPAVCAVEQSAHAHPWTQRNFRDTLTAGHRAQCLIAGDELLGYFVAMLGYREVHLLNIAVAPAYQAQGWARLMLDAVALWARNQQAECVWLEVRQSNERALNLYQRHGFECVAIRKDYYRLGRNQCEDAVVMRCPLSWAPIHES